MKAVLALVIMLESLSHTFYNSCENLIDIIKGFTSEKRYTLTIKKFKLGKVWLKCNPRNLYQNWFELREEDHIHRIRTYLINYLMDIIRNLISFIDI